MVINDENRTELVDAYLDGRLGSNELEVFEAQLNSNSDLRMEVQAQKAVRKNMVTQGRKDLKMKLKEFHQEMLAESKKETNTKEVFLRPGHTSEEDVEKPVIFFHNRKTMYAIAAAVIILMVSTFGILSYRENKQDELAKKGKFYKIEMKDLGQVVMSFGGKESLVSDSLVLFIKGDDKYHFHYQFTDTLTIFSKYLDPTSEDVYVEHDAAKKTYLLIIGGKRYPLERGFIDINPLKQDSELKD